MLCSGTVDPSRSLLCSRVIRATASVSTLNAEKRSAQAVYDAKIVALEQELIAEKAEAAFRIAQLEKRNSELEDSVKVKSSEAETLQRRCDFCFRRLL